MVRADIMLIAVFFLGAAFGISAISFVEALFIVRKTGKVTTRLLCDMFFDILVMFFILHLIQNIMH